MLRSFRFCLLLCAILSLTACGGGGGGGGGQTITNVPMTLDHITGGAPATGSVDASLDNVGDGTKGTLEDGLDLGAALT
jgi:hypothetical protein